MEATLLHRKFKFPKRCNIGEIVLRETNGLDEQDAALAADARGERGSVMTELIRLSVVEVDGQKVQQPWMELEQLNSKTRALIMRGYEELNDLPLEEISVFLASSEDATPGGKAVPKSEAEMMEQPAMEAAGTP